MTDALVHHALPKLTVARMFTDATPMVQIVLTGLLLTGLAALVILLLGLGRPSRSMASATRFLETAMAATPIAALFGASWGLITVFLGIANTNVSNLAVAAPGIADAILSLSAGLLALLLAVIAHRVVKPRSA
jgi:biopolymer transport protein ExbB/TolQ